PYPEDSQKIVAAVVASYKNYQSKQRHTNAGDALTVLQQQKDKRDAELTAKQAELEQYRLAHGMVTGSDEKTNIIKQRLETLSAALTQAGLERIAAQGA